MSAAQVPATPPTTVKVGCIDLAYVAANSRQGKLELSELETFTRNKQIEIDERAKMLGAQETRLRNDARHDRSGTRRARALVRKAQLDFARFREDTQTEVQQFAASIEQPLRARLFPIVDAISKEKGLTLVFTVDAPGLVWFSPSPGRVEGCGAASGPRAAVVARTADVSVNTTSQIITSTDT